MLIDSFMMIGNIREFRKGKMLVTLKIIQMDTFHTKLIVIGPAAHLLNHTLGMAGDNIPGALNLEC